jgi:hypothetical protein
MAVGLAASMGTMGNASYRRGSGAAPVRLRCGSGAAPVRLDEARLDEARLEAELQAELQAKLQAKLQARLDEARLEAFRTVKKHN